MILIFFLFYFANILYAENFIVTSNADTDTAGTLRNAVNQANSNGDATNNITINEGIGTITLIDHLPPISLITNKDINISVSGVSNQVIDGAGSFRGFIIGQGNNTLSQLTFQNMRSQGGEGGNNGGGGAGMGSAIFLMGGETRLTAAAFNNCQAVGGAGGALVPFIMTSGGGGGLIGAGGRSFERGGGAGGGLFGNGGDSSSTPPVDGESGGGGGGLFGDGGSGSEVIDAGGGGGGGFQLGGTNSSSINGADGGEAAGGGGGGGFAGTGGAAGTGGQAGQSGDGISLAGNGGDGGVGGGGGGGGAARNSGGVGGVGGNGGDGGFGGGGGAVGDSIDVAETGLTGSAGNGGFFGGGGGALQGKNGGDGGFGGGGGASAFGEDAARAGNGGFGGGGGGAFSTDTAGSSAFAGGSGGVYSSGDTGGGGGGAALGGALFIHENSTLILENPIFATNSVTGGAGANSGQDGQALGIDIFQVSGGTLEFNISTGATTISSAIESDHLNPGGGVIKSGAALLTLQGANTYSGGTFLNGGSLRVASDGNLGDAAGPLTFDGGTLVSTASFSTSRGVTLSGAGIIDVTAGSVSMSGTFTSTGSLQKNGNGTLVLAGANDYTGGTIVTGGRGAAGGFLNASVASALPINQSVSVIGGTLQISVPQTIGTLTGNGGEISLIDDLTTNSNSNSEYSGEISNVGSLTKGGTGTLTLSGVNTYSGGTLLNGGILSVASDGNLGNAAGPLTFDGGALQTTASFSTARGVTLSGAGSIDVTAGSLSMSGTFTSTGSLQKDGVGTLVLAGANDYSGGTTVTDGVLNASVASALPTNQSLSVTGGTVQISVSQTIGALAGTGGEISLIDDLTTNSNSNSAYSGVISNVGSLTKGGTGTLTLSGVNTYFGGTFLNGGSLSVASDANLGNAAGPLTFNGAALQTTSSFSSSRGVTLSGAGIVDVTAGSLSMSGIFTSTGSLQKDGVGTLVLAGANDYSGGTTVTDGVLNASVASALPTNQSLSITGGTVQISVPQTIGTLAGTGGEISLIDDLTTTSSSNSAYSGVISNVGSLTKEGTSTLTLSGVNTYSGGTLLNGGILSVASDANLGNAAGPLTFDGATLQTTASFSASRGVTLSGSGIIDVTAGSLSMSGTFTSTGSLQKDGVGTLVLAGANDYSGGTTVTDGVLNASVASALPINQSLSVTGGTVQISAPQTIGTLAGTGGEISLIDDLTTNSSSNSAYSGVISNAGSLTKGGTGTFTLSGVNTYSGGTLLNGGILSVASDANLGNAAGPLTFNGATLQTTASFSESRGVTLSGAGIIDVTAGSVSMSGTFTSTGSLQKDGVGTLVLAGANDYSGGTTVTDGVLNASVASALPTNQSLSVTGGTVQISVSQTIGTLAGTGGEISLIDDLTTNSNANSAYSGVISNAGSLTKGGTGTFTLSGVNTYSGGTLLNGGILSVASDANLGNAVGPLTFDGGALQTTASFSTSRGVTLSGAGSIDVTAGSLSMSGTFTSTGSLQKDGVGTLVLAGANDYSGGTTVTDGVLNASVASALPTNQSLSVTGGTVQISVSQTIGTLAGTGGEIALIDDLTTNSNSNSAYSGVISNVGFLTKGGTGTLTLSGVNTYSGRTFLNGGILSVASDGNLGNAAGPLTFDGAALQTTASFSTSRGVTLSGAGIVDVTAGSLTMSGTFTSTGSLQKNGVGTLTLAGANDYSGGTTVTAGVLNASVASALPTNQSLSVTGGTVQISVPQTIGALAGTGGEISLIDDLTTTSSSNSAYSGVISNAGSLTKEGTGTLTLSGVNTYSGGTLLNGGILSVVSDGNLGNAAGSLTFDGGALQTTASFSTSRGVTLSGAGIFDVTTGSLSVSGIFAGTGALSKTGSGTLDLLLSGVNTYSGTISLNEGTLHLSRDLSLATLNISSGGTLTGNGTIGPTSNTGVISPGDSIGIINIVGDYTQDSNGSLVIEIDDVPPISDQLIISGTANLDGLVVLQPLPGVYTAGTTYTFLTASSIVGEFSQLIETHPLSFEIIYPTNMIAQIRILSDGTILPVPISDLDGNAKAIAEYIFSCGAVPSSLSPAIQPLLKVPPSEFSDALLQLGPQKFGSLPLSQLQTITRIASSMNQSSIPCNQTSSALWLNQLGYYYKQNKIQEQTPFHTHNYGFTTGYRKNILDQLVLNFGTGYSYTNLNWYQGSGDAKINTFYLSPGCGYGGKNGYASLACIGALSWYDVKRNIRYTGFNATAKNEHKSFDLLISLFGNMKFDLPKFFVLSPEVKIDYLNIFEESYRERGATPVNLVFNSYYSSFLQSEMKLQCLNRIETSSCTISPSFYVGWLSDVFLSNGKYRSKFFNQNTCEDSFVVQSYHGVRNQLILGLRLPVEWDTCRSVKLQYEATLGDRSYAQEGRLDLFWGF